MQASSPHLRLLGWVLLIQVASELTFLYSGLTAASYVSKALVLLVPVLTFRFLKLREGYLLALCGLLLGLAWYLDKPFVDLAIEGLSRSAYLASFILLMALLREGALASPSVLEVGTFLTRQPSSRRFMTLFYGGHFFAVLINLGALSLLAPIIQRGVRADIPAGTPKDTPLDEIAMVRERRQLSAALRGFSWFLVWAPTAVTQAVMPTLMSGIDAVRLMVTGFGLALVMFVVSWAEDAVRWRGFRKRLQAEGRLPMAITKTPFPVRGGVNLGVVCLSLFALTLVFTALFHVSIVTGVMLTAPIVVLVWVFVQQPADAIDPKRDALRRIDTITFQAIPGYFREVVFIACAGFIGTMAGKLVAADAVASAIGLADLPGWQVLSALTVSVWLFGQVGLSPITMAVFLGSLVAELPDLPVDMTWAALAIAAGTAVCSTGAPFSSGPLMLARATGYSSFTLTWRWNGTYTLIAMAVLCGIYVIMTSL